MLEIVKMRHFKFLIPSRLDNKFSGIGCQFVAKQPCMKLTRSAPCLLTSPISLLI
jgi:hypothetical protein